MWKIQTFNLIAKEGLWVFFSPPYQVGPNFSEPDAILLRSQDITSMELPPSLKAIARAGAGVNNIPVKKCSERGIVVLNTPGANANSVKELVIAGILLVARNIIEASKWLGNLTTTHSIVPQVEDGKSQFVGREIKGKTLGVIGLGAIGTLVANAAEGLGMEVIGYDPYSSVKWTLQLSPKIKYVSDLANLLSASDFVTVHVPTTTETKGMFNASLFGKFKPGATFLNFSRAELVNETDLCEALSSSHVAKYITDFPTDRLISVSGVIFIPHLGAATEEAEINCAVMAAQQLRDFLENGNIVNSVNFPTCQRQRSGQMRIVIANYNRPGVIQHITKLLSGKKVNIAGMTNNSENEIAYNIIDLDNEVDGKIEQQIRALENIIMARIIK